MLLDLPDGQSGRKCAIEEKVALQIRVSQIVLIMNRRILRLRRDGNT